MNKYEFVQSKQIPNAQEKLHKQLYAAHQGESVTFTQQGETLTLTKHQATLGLMLLNCFKDYREENEQEYWSYHTLVAQGSKRLAAFQKFYPAPLWDEKTSPLLWFLFGEEIAPLIQHTWKSISEYMYQKGLYRRSFRCPNDPQHGYLERINFLINVLNSVPNYDLSLTERLENDTSLGYSNHNLALMLVALDSPEWEETFLDIAYNRHPSIKLSYTTVRAMLASPKEKYWKAIGDVLLAAQRQEGLRQVIMESADSGHLGAFKYLMGLSVKHNLVRFSAVARAVETWVGLGWEASKGGTIRRFLEIGQYYLEHPDEIAQGVQHKDNAHIYMALWAQGVQDVIKCQPLLQGLWDNGGIEKRCLALMFADSSGMPSLKKELASQALDTENLQIIAFALPLARQIGQTPEARRTSFLKLEHLLALTPKKEKAFSGKVFAWTHYAISQKNIYELLFQSVSAKEPEEMAWLMPHFEHFSVYHRERIIRVLLKDYYKDRWDHNPQKATPPTPSPSQKALALKVLKDRSETVLNAAVETLKHAEMNADELTELEAMLSRKSAGTRARIIDFLLHKKEHTLQSTEQLLASRNAEQRLAGLDLLLQLQKQKREIEAVNRLALAFKEKGGISNREEVLLDNILGQPQEYHKENGFGLYNPAATTKWEKPALPQSGAFVERRPDLFGDTQALPYGLSKPLAEIEADLKRLGELLAQHSDYEYTIEDYHGGHTTVLLGNTLSYQKRYKPETMTVREYFELFPLHGVWEKWLKDSALSPFDLYAIRMMQNTTRNAYTNVSQYFPKAQAAYAGLLPDELKLPKLSGENPYRVGEMSSIRDALAWGVSSILDALAWVYPYEEESAYRLGNIQYLFALSDDVERHHIAEEKKNWYGSYYHFFQQREFQGVLNFTYPKDKELFRGYYTLSRWYDEEMAQIHKKGRATYSRYYFRHYPTHLEAHVRAYQLGMIPKDELIASMMSGDHINALTAPKHPKQVHLTETYPFLADFLDAIRERILEIELKRGDKATAVTHLAKNINQLYGQEHFFSIVKALGNSALHKGYVYSYGNDTISKKKMLSTLLKRCLRLPQETQEAFDPKAKALALKENRWIELAMYAQQWSPHIRHFLAWDNMESALWWLHAHTNAHHSAETESEIAQYSAMTLQDFAKGGVDVEWFRKAYKEVGKARWKMLYDAAKYITEGPGYTRAKLYADVLLGEKKIRELSQRVKDKRNQDYLRAYGLVPLSRKAPEKDLLSRYLFIQQFLKESKQFGAQRQESERQAVEVALENLSRNAGFSDPMRLTWAMESKQAKEIMEKAGILNFEGGLSVSLRMDEQGKPDLHIERDGKTLKSLPSKISKDKGVVELKAFAKQLRDQHSRTRRSLEEAMVRSDQFLWSEVRHLFEHPVVEPMARHLVFTDGKRLGFAGEVGLLPLDGQELPLQEDDKVRIAHPHDLHAQGLWEEYQKHCFKEGIRQPFKQIFRELYLPTPDELHSKTISRRYEGHQVQTQKAVALFKGRGWRVNYGDGLQKVYHRESIIATVGSMADWFSPADIEAPTLETIQFHHSKDYKAIPFTELNPIIFSEVMRDLDLVVSVAHVGDVDPEASHSSLEMRAVLVRETARLFKLDHVRVEGRHVHLDGQLGSYSIHLGSAQVYMKPGRYLGVIPVHSQHRGRIFLPFADDDPKSAELLSKVLLFAKDTEIQDPMILGQMGV